MTKYSRREADELIRAGNVTINGKKAILGNRVMDGDHVKVGKKLLHRKHLAIYIALNKPKGIVCTTDQRDPDNIIDFIGHKQRIFPIGRLDKLSQGLIFLTNDGDIVNKILRVGNAHEKEYHVQVNKAITPEFIKRMSNGVPILKTKTKPCVVNSTGKNSFKIILVQGLNRQIRRMCEYLGYKVTKLTRTRIMNVSIGKLKEGEWRHLSAIEIKEINSAISSSSKTKGSSSIPKNKRSSKQKYNFTNKKNNKNRKKAKTGKRKTK